MKNDPTVSNIFDLEGRRYPHLKITSEAFPRVLATRAIEEDGDEYFGAFLTRTAVRILIDYLNRRFRLRSCDIEIDGSFPMPCTQYYRRRCLAPCVAKLCSEQKYAERVELVRLFLANDRKRFRSQVKRLIAANSDELNFEEAAVYRDILESAERHWKQPRWHLWLDDAIDTYEIQETPAGFTVYLVTTRGRNVLGRKVFDVTREEAPTPDEALLQIIGNFYVTHLPKEIRSPVDFYGRQELIDDLSHRLGRPAVISVGRGRGINAARALVLGHDEHEIDRARPRATPERISARLAHTFGLQKPPQRVEAFDVAHISGTGFVAASSVWEKGRYLSADYQFILSQKTSELDALADAVIKTLNASNRRRPDLIILDGGKNQLNKVANAFDTATEAVPVIAAVKPRAKHSSIAAFLSFDGKPVPFDVDSPAHAMLQLLRDEAHDLANRVHRDYREMMPFYEKAGFEKPLVVPLRFHAENGGADDLIPINAR
jgi:excinuclease ABC subunit C